MTFPESFGNLPIPCKHVEKPRVEGGRLEETQRATAEECKQLHLSLLSETNLRQQAARITERNKLTK